MPSRHQAIIWINDDTVHWQIYIYALPDLIELSTIHGRSIILVIHIILTLLCAALNNLLLKNKHHFMTWIFTSSCHCLVCNWFIGMCKILYSLGSVWGIGTKFKKKIHLYEWKENCYESKMVVKFYLENMIFCIRKMAFSYWSCLVFILDNVTRYQHIYLFESNLPLACLT